MTVLPSVRARMHERFVINWRLPEQAVAELLPAPWLRPQLVNGYAVASWCVLDLRRITLAPLAPVVGPRSLSCAARYAVIDTRDSVDRPAVFVPVRNTDSASGAWFTTLGFSAPHRLVNVNLSGGALNVHDHEGTLFAADLAPASTLDSALFSTVDEFAALIAQGKRSYGPSRFAGQLTVLDLDKRDVKYEPYSATNLDGVVPQSWAALGGVVDSVFRTRDATYTWTYHGLVSTGSPVGASPSTQ